MQDLYTFSTRLVNLRVFWLRFWEETIGIQWRRCWRRAECRGQRVADILAIQTCNIRQGQYLSPDCTKGVDSEVLLASTRRVQSCLIAQAHHCLWYERRGELGSRLRRRKCCDTFRAIGREVRAVNDLFDSIDDIVNHHLLLMFGELGDGFGEVDRIWIVIWYGFRVRQIVRDFASSQHVSLIAINLHRQPYT